MSVPRTTGIQTNKLAGDTVRDLIAAREAPALTEQTFNTVGGVRRVDVLKIGDELASIGVGSANRALAEAGPEYKTISGTKTTIGKNPSYIREVAADADSTRANSVLEQARKDRRLPPAGSNLDESTVATIRISDPTNGKVVVDIGTVVETNAHGLNPPGFKGAGSVSPTHGEAGTLFAANDKISLKGKDVTIFTDRDPCSFCDKSRGIENVARSMGVKSLKIHSPSGITTVY